MKLKEHLKDRNVFFIDRTNRKVRLVMIFPFKKTAILEEFTCKTLEKAEAIEEYFSMRMWEREEP